MNIDTYLFILLIVGLPFLLAYFAVPRTLQRWIRTTLILSLLLLFVGVPLTGPGAILTGPFMLYVHYCLVRVIMAVVVVENLARLLLLMMTRRHSSTPADDAENTLLSPPTQKDKHQYWSQKD
jgi:hypothetical protein